MNMPLSKIIVSFYPVLLEVVIWLTLIGAFIGGWVAFGFLGAIGGLIVASIVSVAGFGAFLTLADIQKSVRAMEENEVQNSVRTMEDKKGAVP